MPLRISKITILCLLAISTLFSSCAKLKKIRFANSAEFVLKNEIKKKVEDKKTPEYIFIENASVKIIGEDSNKAKVNFYLERDTQLFISIKFIGFEMARFQLTSDSVKYINRLNREYYFGNLKNDHGELTELLNFNNIQNLLSRGFVMEGVNDFDNFFNNSELRGDSLFYKEELSEGQNINCAYGLKSMQLSRLSYFDYVKQIKANVNLDRKNSELKKVSGFFIEGGKRTDFDLDIGIVKNKKYNRTKFKIGRNYNELKSLL